MAGQRVLVLLCFGAAVFQGCYGVSCFKRSASSGDPPDTLGPLVLCRLGLGQASGGQSGEGSLTVPGGDGEGQTTLLGAIWSVTHRP